MATNAFAKLSFINAITKLQALSGKKEFHEVVMDFLKEDVLTKNDKGLKAFALCAARDEGDYDGEIRPFLLRTYDLPEETENAMDGSSAFTVPKAVHSTSALPAIVPRFRTYHQRKAISLADGGFISVAPVAVTILEAEKLYPNRKIGVILSIGLDSANDRSCYEAIDIARLTHPNLHFHRIVPTKALEGHGSLDHNLERFAELQAKTKKYIRESERQQLLLSVTLDKIFNGPSRRPSFGITNTPKFYSVSKATVNESNLRFSQAAFKVGLKETKYSNRDVQGGDMKALKDTFLIKSVTSKKKITFVGIPDISTDSESHDDEISKLEIETAAEKDGYVLDGSHMSPISRSIDASGNDESWQDDRSVSSFSINSANLNQSHQALVKMLQKRRNLLDNNGDDDAICKKIMKKIELINTRMEIENAIDGKVVKPRRSVFINDELPRNAVEYKYCMPFSKRFMGVRQEICILSHVFQRDC